MTCLLIVIRVEDQLRCSQPLDCDELGDCDVLKHCYVAVTYLDRYVLVPYDNRIEYSQHRDVLVIPAIRPSVLWFSLIVFGVSESLM